ncbi:MAG: DEAD/DEAH box helicase [Coriobacteriales bacterium]|nr:DEAD/DEAH box helicase [Coriobacteriales bacterium]
METNAFAELGLNEQILAGVEALGFTTPTPVQAEAIPAVLQGRDVVASAQTGTGKTAAFALPVLQVIAPASRAAREEIVNQAADADADDASSGSDVLADEVPTPSASVPVPPEGNAGQEGAPVKRRRRRHHKKAVPQADAAPAATNAPSAPAEGAGSSDSADKAAGKGADKSDGPAKPRRRSRRRRRRGAQGGEAAASTQAAPAAARDEAPEGKTSADKPKPKRKRRRRKGKAAAERTSTDSREKDPNAKPFGPFALVVTPTRELAQQIDNVVSVVCEHTGQRAVIVMGGAKFERQIRSLEAGCDMLVATPGRLIDLMEHDHVDLSQVQVLVLDEADRMLDMGFWPSVRRIVAALPSDRQNLLFSATIPPSIKSTVDAMLNDPVYVEIARVGETAETVEEHLCPVTQGQKTQLLQELIRTGGAEAPTVPERVLVFCRTKHRVDNVSDTLKNAGFSVDVMHADRQQKARERALERFRSGKCQVLVATDVMSRGIDVSGIDAVVNFDVPLDPEDYVHRIGRTGRAGATGHAYTFVAPDEISPLREIEYFTSALIPTWDLDGFSYDEGRIVPGSTRSTVKPKRTMFNGAKARGRGIAGGRYGRHY